MARDGTVTVKITGDAKGLHDALGESDGHLDRFGGKMGSVAKGVGLAFAGMAAAAVPFGIKAVTMASDVQESFSKMSTIFGTSAGDIDKWARDAANNIGLSRGAALDAAGTFGNMFTQLGIGKGKAAEMSTGIVDLAADFASFHNADISEVISSQSAAFRGEYDALQKFLPLINAASVEQKALEMTGKATTKELNAQEKALAVQALMMEGAGAAQGDFARTSDGLANKMRILKARGEDFMVTVGTALLPIVLKGIDIFMNLGGVLKDNLGPVFEKVKVVVADLAPVFDKIVGAIRGFIDKFRGGEGEIGESAGKLGKIVTQIKEVFESAFGAIKAVVEVAVNIIKDIWDRFGSTILEFIKGTWDAILEVFRAAFNIIDGIFDLIKAVLTGKWGEAWEAIKKILDGAWDLLFGVIRNALTNVIPTLFEAGKALLSAAFGLIWNALKTILSDAWDIITRAIGTAIDGVVTFFRELPGKLAAAAGDLFKFVKDKITDAVLWIGEKELEVIGWFRDLPGKLATAAGDVFGFVKTKMTDAKTWVSERLGDVVGFFTGMPGKITNAASGMFDGIKGAFKGAINWVIQKWNDLQLTIGGNKFDLPGPLGSITIPSMHLDTPNIPYLHAGGVVPGVPGADVLAMLQAGERVIPRSGGGSGASVIALNINVTAIDPAAASEAVITAIKEYERRNGTDWRVA